MEALSSTTRTGNLALLANERFDVLVIGGGVTGAGVALDAAARGYKVALVERTDFACGTSSKSTKLLHGGIRYLPNLDFALVHEGLVERDLLLQNAPFLAHPIPFVLPIYEGDRHPLGIPFTTPKGIGLSLLLDLGLWLYDVLAGRRNVRRHRRISRDEVHKLAPALATKGLKEGFIYYDAQTNDARLTIALIRTAAHYGATIANYAEVTSFISEAGKVCGVCMYDHLGQQEITIRAKHIINATGVFSEQVESLTSAKPQIRIEPSKGTHLVFSRADLRVGENAIMLPETDDKRILFIVPWESRAIFGTTDTGTGDLDHPAVTHEDISYLLEHLNRYLSLHLTVEHIISAYAGYRPLVRPRSSTHSSAKLSRGHVVSQSPSGLVSIVGGKLTTYRSMAQNTVDVLSRRDGLKLVHPTEKLALQGSADWHIMQKRLESEGATLGLDAEVIVHLGRSYGSESVTLLSLIVNDPSLAHRLIDDLPYIRAEVVYACRQEMAMTPYDVLTRRTSIIVEDRRRGLGIVDEVAELMAQEQHWSLEVQHAMSDAYRVSVEQQMADEVEV